MPGHPALSIRFVIALTLFNMTSVRTGRVLLTLYAIRLGADPLYIGTLAAGFSLVPILLSWAAGRWSDRFGARWLLVIGVGGASSGMLLPYFTPSLATVFLAGVLSGLSMSFCNVCLQSLVGLLSTPEDRPRNFSNYTLAVALSAFIGPLIAGFTIDHAGYGRTCLAVVALAGVPLAMLLARGALLPRGSGERHPAGNPLHALRAPGVGRVLAASSVGQTGTDLFQFYMPVYAHAAGLTPSATGIVLAAHAIAAFVVRFLLPRLIGTLGEEQVLRRAFVMGGAAFALVPLCHHAALLAVIAFVSGLSLGCTGPLTMMLMFSSSPKGRAGEALGLRLTVDNLTRLAGPLLFGTVAAATGLAAVFWLNGAMLACGTFFARRAKADPDR